MRQICEDKEKSFVEFVLHSVMCSIAYLWCFFLQNVTRMLPVGIVDELMHLSLELDLQYKHCLNVNGGSSSNSTEVMVFAKL